MNEDCNHRWGSCELGFGDGWPHLCDMVAGHEYEHWCICLATAPVPAPSPEETPR